MRPRFSAAGGKSDSFDAFVLAELARTDSHRFRVLVPDSDATKALRALSRAREELVGHRVALANELRAQLECFWPGAAHVFADIDSPIALAFLQALPRARPTRTASASSAWRASSPATTTAGASPPRELLGRLRGAADGRADALETEARRQIVLALVAALEPLVAQIARADQRDPRRARRPRRRRRPSARCSATPSPPSAAATLLAEIGDCRDRYPTIAALAADGGQAPVAVESGKSKRARFRWACDHRLRARDRHARRHQPPPQPLGRRHLHPRPRARRQPPARDPHPRPRLVRRHLAPLARPRHLRPRPPHRPPAPDRHHPTPVGAPPRHPATARHSRHRRLPAGHSAQRLTASRQPLHPLTQGVSSRRPPRRAQRDALCPQLPSRARAPARAALRHGWLVLCDCGPPRGIKVTPRPWSGTGPFYRRRRTDTPYGLLELGSLLVDVAHVASWALVVAVLACEHGERSEPARSRPRPKAASSSSRRSSHARCPVPCPVPVDALHRCLG